MSKNIVHIIVEKEGVSDDSYLVTEINFKDGAYVEKDQIILGIETSKTAIDIEAPSSGYIFFNIHEDDRVTVGQLIAIISETNTFDAGWFKPTINKKIDLEGTNNDLGFNISKPAQILIEENKIDTSVFKGKAFVTKEDVENFLISQKQPSLSSISINEKSLFVMGGGGHAKMCIEILKQTGHFEIVGIVDSVLPINSSVLSIPVLGRDTIIDDLMQKGLKNAILGIGAVLNHSVRKKLFLSLKEKNLFIPNIIHPSASVEPSVQLGEGNQIMQGAIIGSSVTIGNNCIINSGSIISHDSIIGDNVHIAPGAIIAGTVVINNDSVIGMGVTVFLGIKIGKNVVVNNGINVFNDISDNVIVK